MRLAPRLPACNRLALVSVAFLIGLSVVTLSGQRQSDLPVFRSETNAVLLDFRVVDRDGQFVRDLSAADIRVFEDDVEQPITTFRLIDIPIEPRRIPVPSTHYVSPDVVYNGGAAEGRLFVLVLDDITRINPSKGRVPSPDDPAYWAREDSVYHAITIRALAREFVEERLGVNDRAALITTSGRGDIASEFTNDRRHLLTRIERLEGNFGQELEEGCRNLRMAMESLKSLVGSLSQIPGRRKAIVLFTTNLGNVLPSQAGLDAISHLSCELLVLIDFVQASARANVATYIIDPTGAPTGDARGIRPVYVDNPNTFNPFRQQGLVAVAEATGGFALVNSNDFSDAFERVVAENSSYYMLGYTPLNPRLDGGFRRTRVEVARPGVTVRSRAGYLASPRQFAERFYRGNIPAILAETLQSAVPVSGLGVSVSAMPLRGTRGSRAVVPVLVDLEDAGGGGTSPERPFDVVVAIADRNGKVQDVKRLSVQAQRLLARFDLNPGPYHLRVAAIDASGQWRGSVLSDIDVPDFSKGPLAMSALVVSSAMETQRGAVGFDDQWQQLLRIPPTTVRDFNQADTLTHAVEIYDHDNRASHRIDITTTVTRTDGGVVYRATTTEPREPGRARPVTIGLVTEVPLAEIPPGQYVLTVEAQSSANVQASAARQLPFTVR